MFPISGSPEEGSLEPQVSLPSYYCFRQWRLRGFGCRLSGCVASKGVFLTEVPEKTSGDDMPRRVKAADSSHRFYVYENPSSGLLSTSSVCSISVAKSG